MKVTAETTGATLEEEKADESKDDENEEEEDEEEEEEDDDEDDSDSVSVDQGCSTYVSIEQCPRPIMFNFAQILGY